MSQPAPETDANDGSHPLLMGVALTIGAMVVLRRLLPFLAGAVNRRSVLWQPDAVAASEVASVQQQALEKFARAFEEGPVETPRGEPGAPASRPATTHAPPEANRAAAEETVRDILAENDDIFFELRNLFAEISRADDGGKRQRIMAELAGKIGALKIRLGALDLLPAWQLATAVEGLLDQLAEKPAHFTPSTLRTAGGALVLLQSLCSSTIRKDLAKNPAIRFLAVDDDPISRQAVSMSLKKAFQQPDLAENGEMALLKASRQSYDLVFLDVEMPGMDGFEACSRIHETEHNRHTPVVFVTSHSDFESREKSTASGGRDLIAKPFLSFEITTKALTLVLRHRLEEDAAESSREKLSSAVTVRNQAKKTAPPPQSSNAEAVPPPVPQSPVPNSPRQQGRLAPCEQRVEAERFAEPNATDFASAFAVHAPEHIRELREQLTAVRQAKNSGDQKDELAELYVGIRGLNSEAERAKLNVVRQLTSALENLIRKFVENPALSTASALATVAATLQLVEDLCAGGPSDLSAAAVRALVVDDDALSRRAITGALQLTLARPENADSGEAAVTLAEAKAFDVIFLDVRMPGMDGFTACCKIRETNLNASTPIIFVTGQTDPQSRERSARSGGSGFISKPVLPAEIFLTALTFGFRARLGALVPA